MTAPGGDPTHDGSLWVASYHDLTSGHYVVRFTLGDLLWTHTPRQAERYARAVVRVAQCAAHDAAVLAQLQALGVGQEAAALFIAQDLRAPRPAFDTTATRPLTFTPVVSAATGEPIVQMAWQGPDGEPQAAQLTAAEATWHAVHVLEVSAVTDLDDVYHAALVGAMALGDTRARAAVDDLGRFRVNAAG